MATNWSRRWLSLSKVIAEKESEIAALKKSEGELKEKLSAVSKSLTEAVVQLQRQSNSDESGDYRRTH